MNEHCDVCKIQFQAAEPNEAVADAKIKGLGLWGYLCVAHLDYGVKGLVHMLVR